MRRGVHRGTAADGVRRLRVCRSLPAAAAAADFQGADGIAAVCPAADGSAADAAVHSRGAAASDAAVPDAVRGSAVRCADLPDGVSAAAARDPLHVRRRCFSGGEAAVPAFSRSALRNAHPEPSGCFSAAGGTVRFFFSVPSAVPPYSFSGATSQQLGTALEPFSDELIVTCSPL